MKLPSVSCAVTSISSRSSPGPSIEVTLAIVVKFSVGVAPSPRCSAAPLPLMPAMEPPCSVRCAHGKDPAAGCHRVGNRAGSDELFGHHAEPQHRVAQVRIGVAEGLAELVAGGDMVPPVDIERLAVQEGHNAPGDRAELGQPAML